MPLYLDFKPNPKDVTLQPEGYYDGYYEVSWFDDPIIVSIVEQIDNVRHDYSDAFYSDVTGRFSGKYISGGAKIVVLAYLGLVPKIIPLSWLGENCFKVLGQVPIKTRVIFEADFVPMLWDFDCDFISVQSGKLINNHDTFFEEYCKYDMSDSIT